MTIKDAKVIEWENPGFEDIIWRNPDENIKWGTSLVVKEWESAIFMRDGKLFDVFGPGRHIISTQNLPLFTRSYKFLMGYKETPFKAEVIFTSKKIFNGKWGIRTMVKATEDMAAPIPLMTNGQYQFRIEDPVLFITQVVGGSSNISTPLVNQFLKGFLNEKLIQEFSKYNYMEVFSNLEKTSVITQINISDLLRQRGVELISLKIENIDTEKEYKQDIYNFQRFRSAGGMEYRQFETIDKMAESIGQSNGAGVGTGMLLFPQMYQNLIPAQNSFICSKCNFRIPSGTRFCAQCGNDTQAAPAPIKTPPSQMIPVYNGNFIICPFCGIELRFAKTPKFCPYCKENIETI